MKRLDDAVPIIEAVTAVADQEILVAAAERYGVFRRFSPADLRSLASAGHMHEADPSLSRLIEGSNGVGRRLQQNLARLFVEIVAGLGGQAHVPFLASAND